MLILQIKEDLLGVLEDLEPESIDTAGLLIAAMSAVTNNVEELSSEAQVCELLEHITHGWRSRSLCRALDSALRKRSYQMADDAVVKSVSPCSEPAFFRYFSLIYLHHQRTEITF